MRTWRLVVAAVIAGSLALAVAPPAGAEERTVPDIPGDVSYGSLEGRTDGGDRPAVDVVGATVAHTDAGVRADVFTRAPAPAGMVVTHLLHLELPGDGQRHLVVFRSQQPDVDVITEGGEVSWRQDRCHAATREEVGRRISVVVPPACLPQLGAQTRFRLDSFLWEPPGTLSEQWWERVPADGGFSLHRGERPAGAPDPAADGPVFDPAGVDGEVLRLYRAVLGRSPDASGMAHWLRARWSGAPPVAVAEGIGGSGEALARFGGTTDDEFVVAVYEQALGRGPDADGRAFWMAQLRRGVSRGAVLVHVAESPEHRARTADDLPEGYRAG